MKYFLEKLSFICICSLIYGYSGAGAFPADGVTHLDNQDIERVPQNIPGRCPENMLSYPTEKDSWFCDCLKGYLYFPLNNTCHEAYRRGPCRPGEYMILPKNETAPKCEKNPCEDGLVSYNGTCYSLRTRGGPCHPNVLVVNEMTFEIECTSTDSVPFSFIDAPTSTPIPCPVGSRRSNTGLCKMPI